MTHSTIPTGGFIHIRAATPIRWFYHTVIAQNIGQTTRMIAPLTETIPNNTLKQKKVVKQNVCRKVIRKYLNIATFNINQSEEHGESHFLNFVCGPSFVSGNNTRRRGFRDCLTKDFLIGESPHAATKDTHSVSDSRFVDCIDPLQQRIRRIIRTLPS
jgi:hypothetical protein